MEGTEVSGTVETGTVAVVVPKAKRKVVSADDVFGALEKYAANGSDPKTAKEVAAILGMNEGAFNSAVQKLKDEWRADGTPLEAGEGFPMLVDGRSKAVRGPRSKKETVRASRFAARMGIRLSDTTISGSPVTDDVVVKTTENSENLAQAS